MFERSGSGTESAKICGSNGQKLNHVNLKKMLALKTQISIVK